MIVGVRGRIDVEGGGESAITVESLTLIVALDLGAGRVWVL